MSACIRSWRTLLPFLATSPAIAQQVPSITLSQVEMRGVAQFTSVSSVRELSNGRVLVMDQREMQVYMLAPDGSFAAAVGRRGAGPGEYQRPLRFMHMTGDSVAILDGPRLVMLTPDGRMAGVTRNGRSAGPAVTPAVRPLSATASDARGFLYARGAPVIADATGAQTVTSSASIERWHMDSTRRDTIAFIAMDDPRPTFVVAGMVARSGEPMPFVTSSQWTVAADGRVAIATPNPYRINIVSVAGQQTAGTTIEYERIPVTAAMKDAWRAARLAAASAGNSNDVVITTRGGGSAVTGAAPDPSQIEPASWPSHLPAFESDALRFAVDGRLWVKRSMPPGSPALYDVFENTRLVERVSLPPGYSLAGFGKRAVYLVRKDALGFHYVDKFRK